MRSAPAAIIVAHGSPSAPELVERPVRALARRVGALLPGCRVLGATLAAPGALEAALREAGPGPVVYPMFMADGWFVRKALPSRLRAAGCRQFEIVLPFGRDPAVRSLALAAALDGAAAHGLRASGTALLLAAHGSPSDPRPRDAAERAAAVIRAAGAFRAVLTGFVDEAPRLRDAARVDGPALCLPYFAMRAGHVETDLPEALQAAGFPGPLLAPLGLHPRVPRIVAAALQAPIRAAAERDCACLLCPDE